MLSFSGNIRVEVPRTQKWLKRIFVCINRRVVVVCRFNCVDPSGLAQNLHYADF